MFNYFELNNPTDFQYLLNSAGQDILINDNPARALITNTNLNQNSDNKKITTLDNIERGFLIDYNNFKWLVVSEVNGKRYGKYKGIIQKCNNTLTLNITGILYHIPCIVTDRASLNIDSTTYITTLDTEIYIMVANDAINSNIKVNDIYKIGNLNYQINNIDDISKSGLLVIKLEFTATEQVLPSYSISITNTEPVTTDTTTPVQLNVEQKDRDTVLTEPLPMTFISSDKLIATVDSNGLVTPVSVGNVNISVQLASDETVTDSISIIINEVPHDNYTIEISGSTSITKGYSSTYNCIFRNNGIEIADNSVFYLTGDDGISETTLCQITSQDSIANTCVVKGLGLGYAKLFIKNVEGNITSQPYRIQIKSLF